MKTYITGFMLLISSCGHAYQEDEFAKHIEEFERMYYVHTNNVSVSFTEGFNDELLGLCTPGISGANIQINKRRWFELNSTNQKLLIFHELGHCVLGRNHRNDLYEDGCPKSIMVSGVDESYHWVCFNRHKPELLNELRVR